MYFLAEIQWEGFSTWYKKYVLMNIYCSSYAQYNNGEICIRYSKKLHETPLKIILKCDDNFVLILNYLGV